MELEKLHETIKISIAEIMEKLNPRFASRSGRETVQQYIIGLMSTAERKNGWQLSEALDKRHHMQSNNSYIEAAGTQMKSVTIYANT